MSTQEQPTVLRHSRDDAMTEGVLSTPDVTGIPGSSEAIQVVKSLTTLDHSTIPASSRTQHPVYPSSASEEQKEQATVAKTGWRGRLSSALPLFYRRSSLAEGTPWASDVEPPPGYERTSSRLGRFISPVSGPSTRSARNHPPSHDPPSLRPAPGRDAGVYGNSSSGHVDPAVVEPPPAFGEKQSPAIMPKAFFFYGCKYMRRGAIHDFPRTFSQRCPFSVIMPLFWLLGALVLVVKLQPIPPEECGKTVEEQADMLQLLRQAEEKWAYRCLAALAVFLLLAAIVSISVVVTKGLS